MSKKVVDESQSPVKIAELRAMAKEKDLQAVVVVAVGRDGTVHTVTYGENPRKCRVIGQWADGWMEKGLAVLPFRTIFGWTTGGVPTPLSAEERKELNNSFEAIPPIWFGWQR